MLGFDRKKQLVEELLEHLDKAQGEDLGAMIKSRAAPKGIEVEKVSLMKPEAEDSLKEDIAEGSPEHEAAESPAFEAAEHKADTIGDEEPLSDDELSELLKKYLGQ